MEVNLHRSNNLHSNNIFSFFFKFSTHITLIYISMFISVQRIMCGRIYIYLHFYLWHKWRRSQMEKKRYLFRTLWWSSFSYTRTDLYPSVILHHKEHDMPYTRIYIYTHTSQPQSSSRVLYKHTACEEATRGAISRLWDNCRDSNLL